MLVFIIPLKSLQVSESWERVSKLFERCIKSICNQTSLKFRVIVVCHERPNIEFSHPYIKYVEVNFPVPTWKIQTDLTSRDRDRSRKIWVGLKYAPQLNPTHVMFVDADDCISSHLAEYVSQNSQHNGWFMRSGYEYQDGSKFIYIMENNFNLKTATSHILRYDLLTDLIDIPFDEIKWNYWHHKEIVNLMKQNGTPLDTLPFLGAAYITENGENIYQRKQFLLSRNMEFKRLVIFYGKRIGKLVKYRLITKSIRDGFGIYDVLPMEFGK